MALSSCHAETRAQTGASSPATSTKSPEQSADPQIEKSSEAQVRAERLVEFIHWYPAIEQAKMRDQWLTQYTEGQWQFSGKVTAEDRTVVTPQVAVNYGYTWFNISN